MVYIPEPCTEFKGHFVWPEAAECNREPMLGVQFEGELGGQLGASDATIASDGGLLGMLK